MTPVDQQTPTRDSTAAPKQPRRSQPKRIPSWLKSPNAWVALSVYVVIALVWDRATVAHMESGCSCGLPGDPSMFLWSFVWYPHALLHGLPLFQSSSVYAPTGETLAGTTTVPFVALLMAPLTWLWGPIASFNVASIAAPALNSWAAFRLARYVSKSSWASLIAGVAYGFGTYDILSVPGHMQLFVVLFPPLIALCTLKLVARQMSRWRFVVAVTLTLVAQVLTSTEVLFTMTVVGIVALVVGYAFANHDLRQRILSMLPWLLLAYVIAMAACSYYLYLEFKAPPAIDGSGLLYPTDLLAFVIPTPDTWIGGTRFIPVISLFAGTTSETNAYLGLPMLLIVARCITTRWKHREAKFLAVLIGLVVLWVLGTKLYIAGKPVLWLPYALIEPLPGFDQVLQGRVALYLELICAVILAVWMAEPGRRWLRLSAGVIAVAFVLPNFVYVGGGNAGTWQSPEFFATSMYQKYLKRNATVVDLKWGSDLNFSMLWQAEDHFYWRLADGSFTTPPPSWTNSKIDQALITDTPYTGDATALRAWLKARGVNDVVVVPASESTWAPTLRAAGLRKRLNVGGIYLYPVPDHWYAHRHSK